MASSERRGNANAYVHVQIKRWHKFWEKRFVTLELWQPELTSELTLVACDWLIAEPG